MRGCSIKQKVQVVTWVLRLLSSHPLFSSLSCGESPPLSEQSSQYPDVERDVWGFFYQLRTAMGTSSLAAVNQMLEIIRNHLLYWDLSHMVCDRQ